MDVEKVTKLVIGVVGEANSGKSTAVDSLVEQLRYKGMTVCETNVGDYYRDMVKPGDTLEALLKRVDRAKLDRDVDNKVVEVLKTSIGIAAWNEQYPDETENILVISGRMVSLLANQLISDGVIANDAYYGVAVTSDLEVIGRRVMEKKRRDNKYSAEELTMNLKDLIRMEMLKVEDRNSGDLTAYAALYGINSMADLVSLDINNIVLNSGTQNVIEELYAMMDGLTAFGLFVK